MIGACICVGVSMFTSYILFLETGEVFPKMKITQSLHALLYSWRKIKWKPQTGDAAVELEKIWIEIENI